MRPANNCLKLHGAICNLCLSKEGLCRWDVLIDSKGVLHFNRHGFTGVRRGRVEQLSSLIKKEWSPRLGNHIDILCLDLNTMASRVAVRKKLRQLLYIKVFYYTVPGGAAAIAC